MSDMALEYRVREFTVAEYHRMVEAGILADRERVELLDGRIIEMPPIGVSQWSRHATIVQYLNDMLRGRAMIVGQASFPLGTRSEPQPDVAVLAPRHYAREGRPPEPHEIYAMIELAQSSLPFALRSKLQLYARTGIADYLVVDLQGDRLLHHRDPHDLGYGTLTTLTHGASFTLSALRDVMLASDSFLRAEP